MASMKDIKRRKGSIQSTQQITKAMKLVSTVKLQKAKGRAEQTNPYFNYMYQTVSSMLAKSGNINHPYLKSGESTKKAVVVITSNRGLAGGYNSNIVKLITGSDLNKEDLLIYAIGNKGREALERRGYHIELEDSAMIESPSYEDAAALCKKILKSFSDGEIGEIYLAYTHFKNTVSHEPKLIKLLPVEIEAGDVAEDTDSNILMNYEPTTEEALEGVKNSDYYAALIIPETFTQEMLGFIDGEVDHPTIYYYENEKKNGIAPKITGKAKNAVQEQVNATFISTVAEAVMKAGNALSVVNAGGQTSVEESLDTMQAQLQDYVVMLQSFQSIMTSAEMIMETSQNMLPDMDNMLENGRNTMIGMQTMINSSVDAVDVMGDMVSSSMDMVTEALQYLSVFSDGLLEQMGSNNVGSTTDTGLGTAIGLVQGMQANMDVLGSLITGQDAQIQEINQSLKTIEADLKQLQDSKGDVDHDINTLRAQIREQIQICNKQLNNLMSDYNNNVRPSFRATGKSMQQAFLNAAAMMNGTDVNMDEISDILKEYQKTLQEGNVSLQDSLVIAQELLDKVSKIADNIKRITGAETYEDILSAMAADPTAVADFVSSPVRLETVPVYPVDHYGSAASPFYTILAIWVGALFLVAIIHVGVKPIEPGDHYKAHERYFGRYLLFFLIGQAQTLLIVLGNLYYIEIQCQHRFLYWLAAAVASAAFSCFMYSVTFAFGNVGEALAIVVMVIQVAGSGGTFPIEVLPQVFQWIYPFLPFQFGMKAFKECIAGMYGVDFWINVGKMALFMIIALLLGLALEPPFRKLNHMIEKSKEKTGLMI